MPTDALVEKDRHIELGIGRCEVKDLFARLGLEDGIDDIGLTGLHHL
jgi:hypothetical protein